MTTIFSFPFEQIGYGLRALSLSGNIGNMIAIGLYVIICCSPIIYYFILKKKGHSTGKEGLLPVISLCLFCGIYLYINPGLMNQIDGLSHFSADYLFIIGATIWSVIILYGLLCILHGIEKKDSVDLLSVMRYLVLAIIVLTLLDILVNGILSLISNISAVAESNSEELFSKVIDGATGQFIGYDFNLNRTYIWLTIKYILNCIPSIMLLRVLFISRNIIKTLQKDSFDETAIKKLHKLAISCKNVVIAIGVLTVIQNFMQLVFVQHLHSANYQVVVPIYTLLIVFIIMLLARKFSETRDLKLDNDSFI